ncbi:MAG TPA: hypothetical protein VGG03_22910 [Thermoanaerobaculia bacterium]|jgi:hypothetical protein
MIQFKPNPMLPRFALLCTVLGFFAGQTPGLGQQTPPATNAEWHIINKPSYGRGVGVVPTDCGPGREYDAGLCYPLCPPGYTGVGPMCWRGGSIITADNSNCPWYDKCGLTFARGCSVCPPGYANDGCSCRIDPSSLTRGVGSVPDRCQGGLEYDAGLCYTPCTSGYHGVGPVCWGTCPAGYEDWGAQCAKRIL